MKSLLLCLGLMMTPAGATECGGALGDPSADFFAAVDTLRAAGPMGRRDLDNFIYRSEFMAAVADSAQFTYVEHLLQPRRAQESARVLLDLTLRTYARKNRAGSLGEPLFHSLAEWEAHFDPQRVVDLRLIPELVDDVLGGQKTSSIRRGNPWEIKSGPALFRVPDSGVTVPIVIESVRFRRRLPLLPESDLRAQGPFVADILDERGKPAATRAILDGMQRYYPGFTLAEDVTVIHFRVRRN